MRREEVGNRGSEAFERNDASRPVSPSRHRSMPAVKKKKDVLRYRSERVLIVPQRGCSLAPHLFVVPLLVDTRVILIHPRFRADVQTVRRSSSSA